MLVKITNPASPECRINDGQITARRFLVYVSYNQSSLTYRKLGSLWLNQTLKFFQCTLQLFIGFLKFRLNFDVCLWIVIIWFCKEIGQAWRLFSVTIIHRFYRSTTLHSSYTYIHECFENFNPIYILQDPNPFRSCLIKFHSADNFLWKWL